MTTQINPFSAFNYWFIPLDKDKLLLFKKQDDGGYEAADNPVISIYDETHEAREDLINYITYRPEGAIYDTAPTTTRERYERLIVGYSLIKCFRAGKNPDDFMDKATAVLDMLDKTEFYTAPASTKYHESFPSGLVYHTLRVVDNIIELRSLDKFKTVKLEDAVLVALVHDWCKIGMYESYKKNVKNESGKWVEVDAYTRKDPMVSLGHGASSMFMASRHFKLSTDQACAIRWHMGTWNVSSNEVDELQHSNETYPLVHMLQFADQLSIVSY